MSTWQPTDFRPGDVAHISLGRSITRPYTVLAARSRHLDLRDPRTGISEQRTYDQVASRTRDGVTEDRPHRGGYFEELDRSKAAGTVWTCRCGCENPGLWDACQECQRINPAA